MLYSDGANRFYIGQTNDILSRIKRHNLGLVKSTKPHVPYRLIGYLPKETRPEAMVLEKKLKNLNTEDLRKFIEKYFREI